MARVEVAGRWHKGVVDGSNEGRRRLRGEETEGDDDEGDLRCAGGRCRSAPRRPCVNEAGPTSATAARAPASIRARCVSRAATPPRGGARSERTAQRSSPTRSLPSSMKSPRSAVNERDKRTHSGDTPSCSACVERVENRGGRPLAPISRFLRNPRRAGEVGADDDDQTNERGTRSRCRRP